MNDYEKAVQAGSQVVDALGGPFAVLGLIWKLIWLILGFCVFAAFAVAVIWVTYKLYSALASFTPSDIVASVISEGVTALKSAGVALASPAVQVSADAPSEKSSVEAPGIQAAAALVDGANSPAAKILKESKTALDAYKAVAEQLAGKASSTGA